jgi:hypothetical protein
LKLTKPWQQQLHSQAFSSLVGSADAGAVAAKLRKTNSSQSLHSFSCF